MSDPKHVRAAGAVLLTMIIPSIALGLYALASLLGVLGLLRLLAPERSIRLQRIYPRRVHGLLLLVAAAGSWLISSRP
jgi:hypothetical protein